MIARLRTAAVLLLVLATAAHSRPAIDEETVLLAPRVQGCLAEYRRAGRLYLIFDPFAVIMRDETIDRLGLERISEPVGFNVTCAWRRQMTAEWLNRIAGAQGVHRVAPAEH